MKIKDTLMIAALLLFTAVSYARPPMMHSRHRHSPPPPLHLMHHHRHQHGAFWTGLGVGFISSAIVNPPLAPVAIGPTVGRIWVPPVYEIRPVYDRFGNILRYEQVMVSAGYWRY